VRERLRDGAGKRAAKERRGLSQRRKGAKEEKREKKRGWGVGWETG
jgi:hypothetical protein